jgi:predicted ATPase
MTARLTRVRVAGFRSIKDVELELGPATVLIGPNGAGKSNLLGALTMTRMLAFESLQLFVSRRGGATFLMHYGPQKTPVVELSLEFQGDQGLNAYEARLGYGADESLLFLDERAGFRKDPGADWQWHLMGAGHRESRLREEAELHATPRTVRWLLRHLNFYHFHDTSTSSSLRTLSKAEDDRYLRSDGSNLAAFLRSLRESADQDRQASWRRIHDLVRRVAPFIKELQPVTIDTRGVRLDWVDDQGEVFGPAHTSDGTLRLIALFTALGQPTEMLPLVSCIDEPELGLHPAALELLCGLLRSVAAHRQVIVATQSTALLDHFEPEEVVVAERKDGATSLRRLERVALAAWLKDYSLSELYDKNVLGGRP